MDKIKLQHSAFRRGAGSQWCRSVPWPPYEEEKIWDALVVGKKSRSLR